MAFSVVRFLPLPMPEGKISPSFSVITGQIGATISVHTGPYPLGFGIIEKGII